MRSQKMSALHQNSPAITDHHQITGPDAFPEILIPAPIQIISAIPDRQLTKKKSPRFARLSNDLVAGPRRPVGVLHT